MQRNIHSLVTSLCAMALVASMQVGSKADVSHNVTVNGRYNIGSLTCTAVRISAYSLPVSTSISPTGTIQGGSMSVCSNTQSIFTSANKVTVDPYSFGVYPRHATISSKPVIYKGHTAHLEMEVFQYAQSSKVGWKVISDDLNFNPGQYLDASMTLGVISYAPITLEWGLSSIF